MIAVCLNGDRTKAQHPAVPVRSWEIAAAARDAVNAGAQVVHVHPRSPDTRESLRAEDVMVAVAAVRQGARGVPVSVTTREAVCPDRDARLALVGQWPSPGHGGPDLASVNWHEPGAETLAATLEAAGIGVEAGIWTPAAAAAFARSNWAHRVARVLVELIPGRSPGADGVWSAERVLSALGRQGGLVLVHGEQEWAWPVLQWAGRQGYDVRIGLEDTLTVASGQPARDNAEQVAQARAALAPYRR